MTEYRYFSSVRGRAVQRHGTRSFIGAEKTKDGFVWDTEAITRIPADEFARHLKSYNASLASGCLRERTRQEYERLESGGVVIQAAAAAMGGLEDEPRPSIDSGGGTDSEGSEPSRTRRRRRKQES